MRVDLELVNILLITPAQGHRAGHHQQPHRRHHSARWSGIRWCTGWRRWCAMCAASRATGCSCARAAIWRTAACLAPHAWTANVTTASCAPEQIRSVSSVNGPYAAQARSSAPPVAASPVTNISGSATRPRQPAVLAPPAPPPPAPRPSTLAPPVPPPGRPTKASNHCRPPHLAAKRKLLPKRRRQPAPRRLSPACASKSRSMQQSRPSRPSLCARPRASWRSAFQLTPQGFLVHCKCEKSPCPADGYYHFPAGPEAITEQVVTLLQALQHQYLIPARR